MAAYFSEKYDVVVVGAGNAALCAAIAAGEKDLKVLVLEKAPKEKSGGNSFFTDGAVRFAYNGIDDIRKVNPAITDKEARKLELPIYNEANYYDDFMKTTSGKSDPVLVNQIVSRSFETILWMRDQGVKFELNYENQSFEKNGMYQFFGGNPMKTENKGIGLIEKLNERLKELNIPTWYESQALKVNTKNEKVQSIVVQRGDEKVIIDTNSVVLACGSFEANKEMREKYMGPEWSSAIVRGTEYNTGDGLKMALEAGAQKYGDWSACHSISTDYNAPKVGDFVKPGDIFKKHSYPYGLMVNKNGERFVDEGADIRNYTYAKYGREVLKQPGGMAFQVFDSQVRQLLRKEYELEEATCYQADTLEQLSDQLPINKEGFLHTVEAYNKSVQEGTFNPSVKDGKSTVGLTPPKSNWALKIKEGPFYAFPVTCGITFSFGGIHVSPKGEVLNKDEKPIDGLYAAGEMVGGLFYENYPGASGLMSGAVFGKLAGSSASDYVLRGEKMGS